MRGSRMNGLSSKDFESSFLSSETDMELIIKKLFIDSRPYSDQLKRLLLINTKDCLTNTTNPTYLEKLKANGVAELIEKDYIRKRPTLAFGENEDVKSYIMISFDDFSPSENPQYRNSKIVIDVFSHISCWDIGNYGMRPLKILGYIDGILNNCKLSGIGQLQFIAANEVILNEELAGYTIMYTATHGHDDKLSNE